MQAAVAAVGFPTPVVRAAGGPDDGLGRAFMVMDRAPGAPLLSGLSLTGALGRGPALFGEIPGLLASTMARLHALDPEPVRGQLEAAGAAIVPLGSRLAIMRELAAESGRPDLAQAAQWLIDHPARPAPDVICHGDLHPFNLLRDGARVTLLDWSTALLAPRGYDVASTSLALSEAALAVPGWLRPAVRWMGRRIRRPVRPQLSGPYRGRDRPGGPGLASGHCVPARAGRGVGLGAFRTAKCPRRSSLDDVRPGIGRPAHGDHRRARQAALNQQPGAGAHHRPCGCKVMARQKASTCAWAALPPARLSVERGRYLLVRHPLAVLLPAGGFR